uniref:Uncharacterized protein n=1 Tax=Timema bartmani TaxID=61472 RepID=A0A7R9ETI2_9NEOP|nr:unnamed protein product [Timema bartmani]
MEVFPQYILSGLNKDFPIISRLVYCESSALDHAAIKWACMNKAVVDLLLMVERSGSEPQPNGEITDMGSEHYCLRWNNHQSNLLGVFSQLLQDESLVDVTLACAEGLSIRAHKVVLSACSSYFQTLFVDHPNRHPIVILKDVRFAELRTLVEFMYKGEVNVEYCQLSALLKTAESLKVKGLAEMTNAREDNREGDDGASAQKHNSPGPPDTPTPEIPASASGSKRLMDEDSAAATSSHPHGSISPSPALYGTKRQMLHHRHDSGSCDEGGGGAGGGTPEPDDLSSPPCDGPSDMSMSCNNPPSCSAAACSSALSSRLPSPLGEEPLPGPSGMLPVQQVPLASLTTRTSRVEPGSPRPVFSLPDHSATVTGRVEPGSPRPVFSLPYHSAMVTGRVEPGSPRPVFSLPYHSATVTGRVEPGSPRPVFSLPYHSATVTGRVEPGSPRPVFSLPYHSATVTGRVEPGPFRPVISLPTTQPWVQAGLNHSSDPVEPGSPRPVFSLPYHSAMVTGRVEPGSPRPVFSLPYHSATVTGRVEPGSPRPVFSLPYHSATVTGRVEPGSPRPVFSLPYHSATSLKKEVEWDRGGDDKSTTGDSSSDYRHPHDPTYLFVYQENIDLPIIKCFLQGKTAKQVDCGVEPDSHSPRVYSCMYCGAQFPYQSKLTRHILSHSLETLRYREQVAIHHHQQQHQSLTSIAKLEPLNLMDSHFGGRPPPPPLSDLSDPSPHLHENSLSMLELKGEYVGGPPPGDVGASSNVVLCKFCGKSFPDVGSLIAHLPVLGGPPPGDVGASSNVVLCKFCGKSFPDVGSLIAHLPVHTGDRPFRCEFCGKAFKLRHHMKDHCRVHTGERPFRCSLCGKTFSRSTILKAHEKTHYPKYVHKFMLPEPPMDTEEESSPQQ